MFSAKFACQNTLFFTFTKWHFGCDIKNKLAFVHMVMVFIGIRLPPVEHVSVLFSLSHVTPLLGSVTELHLLLYSEHNINILIR